MLNFDITHHCENAKAPDYSEKWKIISDLSEVTLWLLVSSGMYSYVTNSMLHTVYNGM